MFKYICKRLGLVLMTFTIIFVMCFVLIKLKPIDMNTVGIGQDADKLRRLLEARGYLKPIPEQLFLYLKRIVLDLDFGVGVYIPQYSGQPVWGVFIEKLPPTILINVYSSLLAVPVGIVLGIFAALKKNKWQDHFISTAVMVVISVPSFVYASLLLFILCFKLPVDLQLPKSMLSLPDIVSLFPEKGLQYIPLTFNWDLYFNWPMIKSMLPAVFAMSFGSIAGYARFTRAELTEVLTSEFMLLARTKGLTKSQATVRHACR
jgi:ABC-type dipeptide/oligopeptide/nickel transport system permease component